MTPIRIVRLLGLKAVPYVMALIGALALIALLFEAGFFAPGSLLSLLQARFEDFLALTLAPVESLLSQLPPAYWPGETAPDPSPFWRYGFALGAMVALGAAAPIYRQRNVFGAIAVGAIGLLAAAAAALLFDEYGPATPMARLVFAGAVLAVGLIGLIVGFSRAGDPSIGSADSTFFGRWTDPKSIGNVGWTVFWALVLTAALIGLDASPYSAVVAAWLWFV